MAKIPTKRYRKPKFPSQKVSPFKRIKKKEITRDVTERKHTDEMLRESEKKYQVIVDNALVGIYRSTIKGQLLYVNDAGAKMFEFDSPEEFISAGPLERFKNPKDREAFIELLKKNGRIDNFEVEMLTKTGESIYMLLSGFLEGDIFSGMAMDITERKRIEKHLSIQYSVIKILAEYASITETIPKILKVICENIGWEIGEMWQVHDESGTLCLEFMWHSPLLDITEFETFSKNCQFTKAMGLPGRVWESRQPSWITDIANDPGFLRHRVARNIGLHGAFAFPIRNTDRVTGVLVFFSSSTESLDNDLLQMFYSLGIQIGYFIVRKRMEEQIRISLNEKELLLREVHHRVRSNLQLIISIIRLQARHISNEITQEICRDIENRIRSLALVHERLYHAGNLTRINFADYIRSVLKEMDASYGLSLKKIALKTDIEDIYLDIDIAIPCSLIINELVSNSLKHAFPDERKGEIQIILRKNKDVNELTIKDNGIRIPESLDFKDAKTLGLQLVNTLAKQINGTIDLERSEGTGFHIRFKG